MRPLHCHSPFQLLFGRRRDTPISSFHRILEDLVEDLPQAVDQYLRQLRAQMKLQGRMTTRPNWRVRPIKTTTGKQKNPHWSLALLFCAWSPREEEAVSCPLWSMLGHVPILDVVMGGDPETCSRCTSQNLRSLVTAMADQDADDGPGVELEAQWPPSRVCPTID
jgi:hypothetical protein